MVIHSIFRTSRLDFNINETSSYVDMGILYGNTQAHQDKIRYVDGRGRILPDVYAEFRLINLPPSVNAVSLLSYPSFSVFLNGIGIASHLVQS